MRKNSLLEVSFFSFSLFWLGNICVLYSLLGYHRSTIRHPCCSFLLCVCALENPDFFFWLSGGGLSSIIPFAEGLQFFVFFSYSTIELKTAQTLTKFAPFYPFFISFFFFFLQALWKDISSDFRFLFTRHTNGFWKLKNLLLLRERTHRAIHNIFNNFRP